MPYNISDETLAAYYDKHPNAHGWIEVHPADLYALISEVREARIAEFTKIINTDDSKLVKERWEIKAFDSKYVQMIDNTGHLIENGWEPFAVDHGNVYLRRLVR